MPQETRRWSQFGLRTLLLLVLALCIGLGFLDHRAKRHRQLIAELQAVGVEVDVAKAPALPQWLRSLVGDDLLGATYSASVMGGLTDNQLQKLKGFPNLETVCLGYSHSVVYSRVQVDLDKISRELPQVESTLIKGDR